ncbi:tellurium resistance protein TerD [Flavobacterium sp. 28A]|uniref:TerD family protein n=1 Tax=Flavobacterium sp. 28A TaxID=2735895 RepID=UPI00156F3FC4|nr:TerD family protein [Flavobacterium sp. 28A]NRT16862.1 tellurium resistance protein TerD [Flavobacterium sp. 28A]
MINLEKKKSINLTQAVPSLNNVRVGLSWDDVQINGKSPDCDASVFMLGENGKVPNDKYFVFFNNLSSEDNSVIHNGDNRTGASVGDDETIDINLSQVSSLCVQMIVTITIHNIDEGFNFDATINPSVRIYNSINNSIICQYELSENFSGCDSLIIGRLYRNGSDWEFEAMGQAFSGGLEATVDLYCK